MDSITSNLPAVILVIAGLGLVAMLVLQALQVGHLRQRIDALTRGVDGESLEGVLDAHLDLVHQIGEEMDELSARTATLEDGSRRHFAKQGLVRFNPFPDTGGNQSFALALLDESDDGIVVSSLHSRTGTRIYAKAVAAGRADTSLSTEEDEAMSLARSRRAARSAEPARPAPPVERPAPAPRPRAVTPEPAPARPRTPAPVPARAAPAKLAPAAAFMQAPAPAGEMVERKAVVKGQSKLELPESVEDPSSERTGRRTRPTPRSDSN